MVELTGSEEEKELAGLFETLLEELRDEIQDNFESLSPLFNSAPAVDRTVPTRQKEDGKPVKIIPVDRALDVSEEFVLPSQTVEEIINKFDDIAVGYCFCRRRRSLLGDDCSTDAPTLNCFTFGKSARHTAAQGFAKKVSKEEAHKIMKAAEQAGLIHKAFHPGSRESSPEASPPFSFRTEMDETPFCCKLASKIKNLSRLKYGIDYNQVDAQIIRRRTSWRS